MTQDPLIAKLDRIIAHQYEGGYGDDELRRDLLAWGADVAIEDHARSCKWCRLEKGSCGTVGRIRARFGVEEKAP